MSKDVVGGRRERRYVQFWADPIDRPVSGLNARLPTEIVPDRTVSPALARAAIETRRDGTKNYIALIAGTLHGGAMTIQ